MFGPSIADLLCHGKPPVLLKLIVLFFSLIRLNSTDLPTYLSNNEEHSARSKKIRKIAMNLLHPVDPRCELFFGAFKKNLSVSAMKTTDLGTVQCF